MVLPLLRLCYYAIIGRLFGSGDVGQYDEDYRRFCGGDLPAVQTVITQTMTTFTFLDIASLMDCIMLGCDDHLQANSEEGLLRIQMPPGTQKYHG